MYVYATSNMHMKYVFMNNFGTLIFPGQSKLLLFEQLISI